jgi:hypothetical protein
MSDDDPGTLVVRNEFALVEVRLERRPSGDLLRITDVPGQTSICLDALQLEGLCALGPKDRALLGDPEWRMTDRPSPGA